MKLSGIEADEVLFNSLLDGCFKANELDLAFKVQQTMNEQGIMPSNVTYSILIKIYGKARNLQKALSLIKEMKD